MECWQAPQYYRKFKCLGGSCSDDCCHNLLINVDEATYNSYTMLQDGAMRSRLLGNIEVTSSAPLKGKISLDENGNCPFLRADGLCRIQSECGHDYLSYACRTYPRMFCDAGGRLETYMSMGCEAAAAQALLNKEPMKLVETQLDINPLYKNVLEPEKYRASGDAFEVFRKLRDASLSILQLRKYRLWFRIVMLGFYIQRTERLVSAGTAEEIAAYTKEYIVSLEDVDYVSLSGTIPDRYDVKISRVFAFFEFVSKNVLKERRESIGGCFERMREGLGIHSIEQPMREVIEKYIHVRDTYYAPFFVSREHILENYIVNSVLSSGFPFSYRSEKGMYGNFAGIVGKYIMVKFLLTGTAGYHKEAMNEDAAVKTVAAFSRFFDHDKELSNLLIDGFNSDSTTDMVTVSMLVKD